MAGVQFNPTGGPPATSGSNPVLPNVGVRGGTANPGAINTQQSWYVDGMETPLGGGNWPEFLNETFAAPLEAAKTERMWKGFTDAAAGMTAEQVRDEQPWFTKLFGPTEYESAVTMFDTQRQVSDMANEWAQQMPELRKLPGEEVQRRLVDTMKGMQTDNPFGNLVRQKTMMQQFAPLIQMHTKERIAWQQAELNRAQLAAAQSAGSAYQQLMSRAAILGKDGPMDQQAIADQEAAANALRDSWYIGRFQNDESATDFLTNTLRSYARSGDFYSAQLMINDGMIDTLSIQDQETVLRQYEAAQVQFRNRFTAQNPEFSKMIAEVQTLKRFGQGGEPTRQMMNDINSVYAAMTGAPMPYYDADTVAAAAAEGASSWLRRYERMEDRQFALEREAATAEAKAAAEARNKEQLVDAFQSGSAGEFLRLNNVQKGDADRASAAAFNQMMAVQPEQAIGFLIENQNNAKGSYVNDQIATQLRDNLQNSLDETVSDAFMAQYGVWRAMYNGTGYAVHNGQVVKNDAAQGRATALAYYTPTVNAKMLEFHRKLEAGLNPDRAYATTFAEWVTNGTPDFRGIERGAQKESQQAFLGAIDKFDAGLWSRMFGNGYALHPSARAILANRAAPAWEQLGDGLLPEHRAKAAVNLALQGGRMEIVAGQVLDYSRTQQPLTKFLNDPDGERTSDLFDFVLRKQLKDAGTTPDGNSVIINRLADENGVPIFAVTVETDDGQVMIDVRGDDLLRYEDKVIELSTKKPKPIPTLGFSTPVVDPNVADPYWGGKTYDEVTEQGRRNRQLLMQAPLAAPRAALDMASDAASSTVDWLYNLNSPKPKE